jgi:hypothetical protein
MEGHHSVVSRSRLQFQTSKSGYSAEAAQREAPAASGTATRSQVESEPDSEPEELELRLGPGKSHGTPAGLRPLDARPLYALSLSLGIQSSQVQLQVDSESESPRLRVSIAVAATVTTCPGPGGRRGHSESPSRRLAGWHGHAGGLPAAGRRAAAAIIMTVMPIAFNWQPECHGTFQVLWIYETM